MQTNEATQEIGNGDRKERVATIDFKMVTFSLAGKDYGVDIMSVKEIAKAGRFTYVPNAANHLRGVYNLRGDIIPIIDLRVFFHLPAERKHEDALESMLILRLDDHVFGVIVDTIDKVVGIYSRTIQPPHPIFGDINIKYIRGVVEDQGRLYIILDVLRIFAQKEDEKLRIISEAPSGGYFSPVSVLHRSEEGSSHVAASSSELEFIEETLFALKRFTVTELNHSWVVSRFKEWKELRKGLDVQLKNIEEAEEFISPFYSPNSGAFWGESYAAGVSELLPDLSSRNINVWNPGCGKGHETFSLACILKSRYPEARIKIWANDSDLLAISSAPNMVFEMESVPEYCRSYLVKGRNGYTFGQVIKESILFEYHDIQNANPFPELDFIVARDVLSFLTAAEQVRIVSDFQEKLKGRGIVLLGRNENIQGVDWKAIGRDPISAYVRSV